MTNTIDPELSPAGLLRSPGAWACLVGAAALVLVFVQIVLPMTQPQPSAATQVGEMAGEMARAAWRSFLDRPGPEPEAMTVGQGPALCLAVPVLAGLALLLAALSGVRRETGRLAIYGAGLGAAALLAHFLWWLAMVILGMMLLIAIVQNLGDFFSF